MIRKLTLADGSGLGALSIRSLLSLTAACIGLTCFAAAQCPADDAFEPNDDCSFAVPGATGLTNGLVVTDLSEDFWTYLVPVGEAIRVRMVSDPAQAVVAIGLYSDSPNCIQGSDGSGGSDPRKSVSFVNQTGTGQQVTLRVWVQSGTCGEYSLDVRIFDDPCVLSGEDSFEDNDSCATPIPILPSPQAGLFVSLADPDYFTLNIPAGDEFFASVIHEIGLGVLELRILDGGSCPIVFQSGAYFSDSTNIYWTNNTQSAVQAVLEVQLRPGGPFVCQEDYTLEWSLETPLCSGALPDVFEPNNSCSFATPLVAGLYPNLGVGKALGSGDWYEIIVPADSILDVEATFAYSTGDINMELRSANTQVISPCGGLLLHEGKRPVNNETVTYVNMAPSPVPVYLHTYLFATDPNDCAPYDLEIAMRPIGATFSAYCFGDGAGAPCPCNNSSSPGHRGGCAHSEGDGAILLPSGDPNVSSDGLTLRLVSAVSNTFGLLLSADNRLPQVGSCLGCGIAAFDGLRCLGGNLQRHGIRPIGFGGDSFFPWGAASGMSIVSDGGFTSGQTRNFSVFYRTEFASICQSGQNSSNAVSVTFAP